MANFSAAERAILAFFTVGKTVDFQGSTYTIKTAGKPTCPQGEAKTDVYILLQNNCQTHEIKISYKKSNADFLENKIGTERAEKLFGADWQAIIQKSTEKIRKKFLAKPLIYKTKYRRTQAGAITLGWKFELMNKPSGELSGEICLSQEQYLDVHSGINLPEDKRHACVNGIVIKDSGVANYILLGNKYLSAQDVLDNIQCIKDYILKNDPKIYFACKALNYRTFEKRFDGNRPLAVQVDWQIIDNKLTPRLVFDSPLIHKGNAVADKLKECLLELNIATTDDINETNAKFTHVHQ